MLCSAFPGERFRAWQLPAPHPSLRAVVLSDAPSAAASLPTETCRKVKCKEQVEYRGA